MELTTREDIEAPIDFVFDRITDFPTFERSIMRRGGDVERLDGDAKAALGTRWSVKFLMRGAERKVVAELVEIDSPSHMKLAMTSNAADADLKVELVPLSRARTRMIVHMAATAKSIPAKLFFQSLRFARQKSQGRFKEVVTDFAGDVETRYRA